jgi:superfamily II DNA or RNA helicase
VKNENDVISKKNEIQNLAEEAHEAYGCRSTCCLSVGLGKSVLAIKRIVKAFKKNSDAKVLFTAARDLHLLNFKKELSKFGYEDLIEKISFCCNKSLKKYEGYYFDLLIVDESHMEIDIYINYIEYLIMINENVEILCLTGTPKTNHENYEKVQEFVPISFSKIIDDAIDEEILNNYNIHVIKTYLNNKERNQYSFWHQRYKNGPKGFSFELQKLKLMLKGSEHKERLVKLMLSTMFNDKKVLVYANTIDQANKLGYPTYHSGLNKNERLENYTNFYNDDILHLVNVNGIKESVSIPNLKYGILMYVDASRQSMEQAIGRFLRLPIEQESHVYIFCTDNTIEESWLTKSLSYLDQSKIKHYDSKKIEEQLNNKYN